MSIKTWFEQKALEKFKKFALSAVIYAEEYLGSGAGQAKKELAINYLMDLLPVYLKPFSAVFKTALINIADKLIEKAVETLHKIQRLEAGI